MMEWESKNIDLGTVREKITKEIIFKIKGEVTKKISNLDSSCGCSLPKWDEEKGELKVIYTPGSVPKHLLDKEQEFYKSSKSIYIKYEDDTNDVLTFTAKVTKK